MRVPHQGSYQTGESRSIGTRGSGAGVDSTVFTGATQGGFPRAVGRRSRHRLFWCASKTRRRDVCILPLIQTAIGLERPAADGGRQHDRRARPVSQMCRIGPPRLFSKADVRGSAVAWTGGPSDVVAFVQHTRDGEPNGVIRIDPIQLP